MSAQKGPQSNAGVENISELRLPPKGQGRTYAGRGQGALCAWCGAPIQPSQVEYEAQWDEDGEFRRSHFHLACYQQCRSSQDDRNQASRDTAFELS